MSETEQTPENDIQFSPGSLLKQARERADISIEEVAQKLKLTRQTIISIESDDYSLDLPVTFYRGYLRNYAELLKMDDDDLIENFENFCQRHDLFNNPEQSFATIELEKPLNSGSWLVKIFTTIIVLTLLLGVYYLLVEKKVWQEFTSSVSESSEQESLLSLEQDSGSILPISDETSQQVISDLETGTEEVTSELTDDELSAESLASGEPEAVSGPEVATTNTATSGELIFVFSDDCWVRITDANGKVLALGIKKGGTSMSLSGPTPIELTLGKPSAVQLSYQNEPVDLSSYPDTRAARLTLGD